MEAISVRVISLDETKFNVAKKKIQEVGNFTDIEQWNAVRGKDFFDNDMNLYANYRDILKKKYPQVLLPQNVPLLSIAAEKSLRYGHKTTIYDFHNAGAVGCALSHISLWQYMVKNNIPAMLIFEDDVDFAVDDFAVKLQSVLKNYAEQFDVFNFNSIFIPYPLNDYTTLCDTNVENISTVKGIAVRLQGYFITNAGARKLLQNVFPLLYIVDVYLSMHTILPSSSLSMITTRQPWLNHPLIVLDSSIGYSVGQTLTDPAFLIPKSIFLLAIAICFLLIVVGLICGGIQVYRRLSTVAENSNAKDEKLNHRLSQKIINVQE